MKKLVCVICSVALLLSGCSVSSGGDTANYTQAIYELTFNTKEIHNHSVGKDWAFIYTYNGETVRSGFQIILPFGETSLETIEVEVIERDTINDVGTGILEVAIYDGSFVRIEVEVIENAGQYKGRSAVWEIICTVKLVGKQ